MEAAEKDLEYYRKNAEEDYLTTPISVLRYIQQMEEALCQTHVSGELAVDECKCIRFTGGDKWYPNGCKIHPNG